MCVHRARASPPRGRKRERRRRGRERFRSRVEVSWCHGNTRRDRERLWPPFPLPTHWWRMRERIVAFEELCTRLTAAPSKEEENRSFLSHPPTPIRTVILSRWNGSICRAYIGKTIRSTERNYIGHRAHDFFLKANSRPWIERIEACSVHHDSRPIYTIPPLNGQYSVKEALFAYRTSAFAQVFMYARFYKGIVRRILTDVWISRIREIWGFLFLFFFKETSRHKL